MSGNSDDVVIRRVTAADIAVVAGHRISMFQDMGSATPDIQNDLRTRTEAFLRESLPSGEYLGWLAMLPEPGNRIVAGAGVQRRRVLPFPRPWPDNHVDVAAGSQAIVLNVYTEAAYRRRGIARRLMHEVLGWARDAGIESLVLHASSDGRALYERLGFATTNEMRYVGDLAQWTSGSR